MGTRDLVLLSLLSLAAGLARSQTTPPFVDPEALPDESVFPGPWERYIQAPANKSFIEPVRVWRARGNVSTSTSTSEGRGRGPGDGRPRGPGGGARLLREGDTHVSGRRVVIGPGGRLTLEFAENIGGRYVLSSELLLDGGIASHCDSFRDFHKRAAAAGVERQKPC